MHLPEEDFGIALRELRRVVALVGTVVDFATWWWLKDAARYQWARIEVPDR